MVDGKLSLARFAVLALIAGFCATPACGQFTELGRVRWLDETNPLATGNEYVLVEGSQGQMFIDEALDAARFFGGWIWTVQSRDEELFVAENLRDFRTDGGDFWIGLTDSEDFGGFESVDQPNPSTDGWVWFNGEPVTYTNWDDSEPNDFSPGEDFAELWQINDDLAEATWNDIFVTSRNWAVIEVPVLDPPVTLQIDPATGIGRFVGDKLEPGDAATVSSYTIDSPSGMLADEAWAASNLDARGVDGLGGGFGESWDVINAADDQLFEAFLFGATEFEAGEQLVIGQVVAPGTSDGDLEFSISASIDFADPDAFDISTFTFSDVEIQFVSWTDTDFNNDGRTDAADYTVWRDTLGSTSDLRADGDGNGVVDENDYGVWAAAYASGVAPNAAVVPEPGAVALTAVLLAVGMLQHRARKHRARI